MDFNQFAFWLLCGLLSAIAFIIWTFLSQLISVIKNVQVEMSQLNEKMAAVVTNLDWHGKELSKLDSRLTKVEETNKGDFKCQM